MKDAFKGIFTASQEVDIRGMVFHAISDDARAVYLKMGFDQPPTAEMTRMVSVKDLREIF